MTRNRSSRARAVLMYGLIGAFFVGCWTAFRADIAQISLQSIPAAGGAIAVAAGLSLLNYALRALRWKLYLDRLGHVLPVAFVGLTYVAGFAFTLSPGKVGELVRAAYYRRHGVPVSAVTAAFFVERLMDLVAMVGLALFFLATGAGQYGFLLWAVAGAMFVAVLTLSLVDWKRLIPLATPPAQAVGRLRALIHGVVGTLGAARVLLAPPLAIVGLLLGLLAWGAEGVGLQVIGALAPGVELGAGSAVGIYAVAIVVGAISFLPGGLGTTEAVMVALLLRQGYAMPEALLLTLACRLLTLWFAVALGWLAIGILKLRDGKGCS